MVGFACGDGIASVDNFTLRSWNTSNSSFDITEHVDLFDIDGNGRSANDPAYDLAGNMTFDGTQKFTFDAWNRLVKVAHAYRDGSNNVQSGASSVTMRYDGRGRRVSKAITNTGQWDCSFKYYYDRDSLIETRNGSDGLVKQHVWGTRYIDELVQISTNDDPSDGGEQTCETSYWACQDANYNVLGVVDSSGLVKERYEYKPYGERSVFVRSGSNDMGVYAPVQSSDCVSVSSVDQPYGICEVGHQGLVHDEEVGLVYNRARALHPGLGRFVQRDSAGYVDTPNLRPNPRRIAQRRLHVPGNRLAIHAKFRGDPAIGPVQPRQSQDCLMLCHLEPIRHPHAPSAKMLRSLSAGCTPSQNGGI